MTRMASLARSLTDSAAGSRVERADMSVTEAVRVDRVDMEKRLENAIDIEPLLSALIDAEAAAAAHFRASFACRAAMAS